MLFQNCYEPAECVVNSLAVSYTQGCIPPALRLSPRWSVVSWRRATRPMLPSRKPGTPIVRVDKLGERIPHAWRAFHTDKSRRRARDRASATSSDRICHHQEEGQIADESGFPDHGGNFCGSA